jgi:hypothetical protein
VKPPSDTPLRYFNMFNLAPSPSSLQFINNWITQHFYFGTLCHLQDLSSEWFIVKSDQWILNFYIYFKLGKNNSGKKYKGHIIHCVQLHKMFSLFRYVCSFIKTHDRVEFTVRDPISQPTYAKFRGEFLIILGMTNKFKRPPQSWASWTPT